MYPCTKCGACCRTLSQIPDIDKAMLNNDGSCKFLINNQCSIYQNRPEFCNVQIMYEKYFKDKYSLAEFYKLNIEVCNNLQEMMKIDTKFRIVLIET